MRLLISVCAVLIAAGPSIAKAVELVPVDIHEVEIFWGGGGCAPDGNILGVATADTPVQVVVLGVCTATIRISGNEVHTFFEAPFGTSAPGRTTVRLVVPNTKGSLSPIIFQSDSLLPEVVNPIMGDVGGTYQAGVGRFPFNISAISGDRLIIQVNVPMNIDGFPEFTMRVFTSNSSGTPPVPCGDSDGDGECDPTDQCPNTSSGPVDSDGCSLEQFCDSFNPIMGHLPCRTADFQNTGSRDCTTVRQMPRRPVVYRCVPK